MRDTARSRVYAADKRASASLCLPALSWQDTAALVHRITASRWWRNRCPITPERLMLKDGRGSPRARGGAYQAADGWHGIVALPRSSRTALIILHELAHVWQHTKYPARVGWDIAPHGAEFRALYLTLIRRWLSPEAARLWRAAYREYRPAPAVRRGDITLVGKVRVVREGRRWVCKYPDGSRAEYDHKTAAVEAARLYPKEMHR